MFTHITWGENPWLYHGEVGFLAASFSPLKGQEQGHWGENPWLYLGEVGFLAASFSPLKGQERGHWGKNPWLYLGEVGFLATSFSPQRASSEYTGVRTHGCTMGRLAS